MSIRRSKGQVEMSYLVRRIKLDRLSGRIIRLMPVFTLDEEQNTFSCPLTGNIQSFVFKFVSLWSIYSHQHQYDLHLHIRNIEESHLHMY